MTSKAKFLEEAIEILEDLMDGENVRVMADGFLQRYYETLKRGNRGGVPRNAYITKQFEKAKAIVASGKMIKDACAETGLTRDQYNRRMRMEKQGRDRVWRDYE